MSVSTIKERAFALYYTSKRSEYMARASEDIKSKLKGKRIDHVQSDSRDTSVEDVVSAF